ncbi:hypothetical protein SAMN05216332_104110 [Nitrosospira briensis]|nr:hypothetical protein SAMN05216332_104110 [Nitrosospira briensis]
MTFSFLVNSVPGGLHSFFGASLRCSSLEWGAPKRCTRGPWEAGIGQRRECRDRVVAPHPATGSHFVRKALLRPARSRTKALHEGPREAGIGQRRGCREQAPKFVCGACIPLRGRTFLRKARLRPARSRSSASIRLALHPKNRSLHPVQLPDSG